METFVAAITSAPANPSDLAQLMTPAPAARRRRRRRRCRPRRQKSSPTACTASPADTSRSPSSSKTTSSCSRADRAKRAGSPSSPRRSACSRQADQVRRQHPPAFRSRRRAGAVCRRRHHHPDRRQQQVLHRSVAGHAAHAGRRRAGEIAQEAEGRGRDREDGAEGRDANARLHHVAKLEHSDAMLIAYLPKERILFTADFNRRPGTAGQPVDRDARWPNIERLRLDFERHVTVHAPNPDRVLTKADLLELAKRIESMRRGADPDRARRPRARRGCRRRQGAAAGAPLVRGLLPRGRHHRSRRRRRRVPVQEPARVDIRAGDGGGFGQRKTTPPSGRAPRSSSAPASPRRFFTAGDMLRIWVSPNRNPNDNRVRLKRIERRSDGWKWRAIAVTCGNDGINSRRPPVYRPAR